MALSHIVEDLGSAVVVQLRGRVDVTDALQLRRVLATVPMHRPVLVVDFFDVPECHPCAHTVLSLAARRLHRSHVQLVLWRVRRQPWQALRGLELQRTIPFVAEPLDAWLAGHPSFARPELAQTATGRQFLVPWGEAAQRATRWSAERRRGIRSAVSAAAYGV